jgi:hypothetical protein
MFLGVRLNTDDRLEPFNNNCVDNSIVTYWRLTRTQLELEKYAKYDGHGRKFRPSLIIIIFVFNPLQSGLLFLDLEDITSLSLGAIS